MKYNKCTTTSQKKETQVEYLFYPYVNVVLRSTRDAPFDSAKYPNKYVNGKIKK